MQKQLLPIGTDSFEKLRTMNKYYVDKTLLIKDLLNAGGEVTLFTRPRRFGKTLNMSMLQYFFEIPPVDQLDDTVKPKALFEGLAISREQELCARHMGKYPVVFITLKEVKGSDFQQAYGELGTAIRDEAFRLEFLKYSDRLSEDEKLPFRRLLRGEETRRDITGSLKLLTRLLAKHYGQKAILLIDEYDVPLDKACLNGYYDEMLDFIRSMFGQALKTNNNLNFAVLSGCLRVSKESIFTGLNNLKVYSINDSRFADCFGFTNAEVLTLLDHYGLQIHYAAIKEWYDGYRFGKQEIYCPWDVINYACDLLADDALKPQAYWLNSSGNEMVRRLIEMAEKEWAQSDIEDLLAGRSLRKKLNLQLTHNEIFSDIDNLWSMLYMTGYLTLAADRTADNSMSVKLAPAGGCPADLPNGDPAAVCNRADELPDCCRSDDQAEDIFELVIPNREIRKIYQKQVLAWLKEKSWPDSSNLTALYTAFATGDSKSIQDLLNDQLLTTISFYDAQESFYHGFLLALLNTRPDWKPRSNRESGRGRSDILVRQTDFRLGLVIEIKYVRDAAGNAGAQQRADAVQQKLQAACDAAIRQIIANDYAAPLRELRFKEIRAYGIAFCGKQCRVAAQKLS